MSTFVLVHGLWVGAWSWSDVQARLARAGARSEAVELPLRGLAEDAAVVAHALERIPGPVVLVGHSYGGAVVTVAGDHPAVEALVFVASFPLDTGESISRVHPEIAPTALGAALRFSPDGQQVTVDPVAVGELFYESVSPVRLAADLARMRPVARALFSARPSTIAWRARPSSYVVCTADRAVSPELQRVLAQRTGQVVELDCGHNPLSSHPDQLAEILLAGAAADR